MSNEALQKTEITSDDWILGRSGAPVTLLEYGDFECPFCAAARPMLENLVVENPDTIRLVYRHFPIRTLHPHAQRAAEAAEAAGAQGRFWEMHDMLFAHQRRLDYDDLLEYAAAIGVDTGRFDDELASHVYLSEIRRDFRHGIRDGVNGTPTIFINGVRYDGARKREAMLDAIAELSGTRGRRRGAA
ncbi:MAG: DsbA family protein [Longimicrobiales bacterium]